MGFLKRLFGIDGHFSPAAVVNAPDAEPAKVSAQTTTTPLAGTQLIEKRKEEAAHGIAETLISRAGEYRYRKKFERCGVSAILSTNERAGPDFYKGIARDYRPDGYIYGPGCGNILTMVEAFPATPKGLVIVDIDPEVVYFGKSMVNRLKDSATFGEFASMMALMYPGDCTRMLADLAESEPVPEGSTYPEMVLARRYDMFHGLAKNGNIAVLHADLFDTELIRYVSELPQFRKSNNLVYISNVPDHIAGSLSLERAEGGEFLYEKLDELTALVNGKLQSLRALDPQPPHMNIFVNTTQRGGYELRAGTKPPQYDIPKYASAV